MRPVEARQFCVLDEIGKKLMQTTMNQLDFSARAYHRVLKLARTIADLAGNENIGPSHLAEALQYRPRMGMLSWEMHRRLIAKGEAMRRCGRGGPQARSPELRPGMMG